MNKNVTLTPEILELISKSNQLFEQMRPLLSNGHENEQRIMELNDERLKIDTKLGSLLRALVK